MRALLGQISPVVGDVAGNLERCRAVAARAAALDCRLALMPELAISGYPPRDLLDRNGFVEACRAAAESLAQDSGPDLVLVFGCPWRDELGLRNAAIVAQDGRIVAVVPKTLLPTYDVFDEARHFRPNTAPAPLALYGPRMGSLRLGVSICEDIWKDDLVPEAARYDADPVLAARGCDVLVNLSASPFHAGKAAFRRGLLARQAARVGAPLLLCNQVGANDELIFDGNSMAVRADGRLIARGAAFAEEMLLVDTDGPDLAFDAESPAAEHHAALVLGIRDYATRCGFKSAVLGLSGGIDSAVVAALAVDALGADNVLGVGLPGPYSSDGSVQDAAELARNLGIRYELLPITGLYDAMVTSLAPVLGGGPRGVTEENLQARARGVLLMALSNKQGRLLLTTGNKSEMAVGYCTLYGDMCGGIGPIGDLYKMEVYALAAYINRDREIIPVATLTKAPSAELAPGQTDQDSLPPYPVLDVILKLYVEGGLSADEIVAAGHHPETVARVLSLVTRSEHKRGQAAPVLRVSPKAFGMGRRVPVAARWRPPAVALR